MRRFAFVLFLFLLIASVCLPAYSRQARHRSSSDDRRYQVVTRHHAQQVGDRFDRASRGLSRACRSQRITAVPEEAPAKTVLSTDKVGDGIAIQK